MTRMKYCELVALVLGGALVAGAGVPARTQAPASAPSAFDTATGVNSSGNFFVNFTNRMDVPATEWMIEASFHHPAANGRPCNPAETTVSDGCVHTIRMHGERYPLAGLASGAGQQVFGPVGTDKAVDAKTIAVIYADGQTYGNPSVVREMLGERQMMLQDLRGDKGILENALAAPSVSLPDLISVFKAHGVNRVSQANQSIAALGIKAVYTTGLDPESSNVLHLLQGKGAVVDDASARASIQAALHFVNQSITAFGTLKPSVE